MTPRRSTSRAKPKGRTRSRAKEDRESAKREVTPAPETPHEDLAACQDGTDPYADIAPTEIPYAEECGQERYRESRAYPAAVPLDVNKPCPEDTRGALLWIQSASSLLARRFYGVYDDASDPVKPALAQVAYTLVGEYLYQAVEQHMLDWLEENPDFHKYCETFYAIDQNYQAACEQWLNLNREVRKRLAVAALKESAALASQDVPVTLRQFLEQNLPSDAAKRREKILSALRSHHQKKHISFPPPVIAQIDKGQSYHYRPAELRACWSQWKAHEALWGLPDLRDLGET
jgi:hypothetical protein